MNTLENIFNVNELKKIFNSDDLPINVTLYGEGYGEKIQSGGKYRKKWIY